MNTASRVKEVPTADLNFLLRTLNTLEAEIEQLEITEDWYSSDSRDLLDSATEIIRGHLGIEEINYDEDEEVKQTSIELYLE